MKRYTWSDVALEPMPAEGSVLRRFVNGERITVATVTFTAGSAVLPHRHDNEQFAIVLTGAMEFTVEGAPVVLHGGDMLHLEPGELHGARALEDSVVLDVFAPPRADWGAPGA